MSEELSDEKFWGKKIKEHMVTFIIVLIAGACIIAGLLIVLFWVIESSPIGNYGDALIGDWSLDWIVGFLWITIGWELLFVGIPTLLFFGVGGYIWWKRLPEEEKAEFKARDKKKNRAKKTGGSGGGGIVIFIAYLIYMGVQGYYYVPFSSMPYSFWVYSWFLTIMWIAIVIGIPACVILIIVYFTVWRKKSE
ncbi:MAG: hypothetical protein EAX91_14285 [Candidatus Lokiarchaeota archaeon]|nr:hypothetical protein [Candidatus Lokiarchaeota archaeon]